MIGGLRQSEAGFSLVEVVVALGILSTAAIGFSELSRGSVEGAKQVEMRYLARSVAEAEMVRTFADRTPLRLGLSDGEMVQMGRSFEWVRTVTETGEGGLLLIRIEIFDPQTGAILAQTSTLKEAGG